MDEQELDNFIRSKINEVELAPPDASLNVPHAWRKLEPRLDNKRSQPFALYYSLAIAASISLLFILLNNFYRDGFSEVEVSYTYEVAVMPEDFYIDAGENPVEKEVLTLLEEKCRLNEGICLTEEFIQLKEQLAELKLKEKEVQREFQRFGQDPSVIKAQIKIENMKADILKKLIKI